MPNPITNAIGTQRQFSKRPERPYEARLITPSYGKGISMSADNNAQALATALGGLSVALTAGSVALDKRRQMIGEAEANRLFAVTSEKDKEKLAALDILGRSEQFDIADNPYAVARIDELRGQHLNTLLKNEYDNEVFPNSDLAVNSQENIKNFENFMDTKRTEFDGIINNQLAFDKGFYNSRPLDVLAQDAKYRKQKQANLETDRNAAITSKIDDVLANAINKKPDELAGELQDIQEDTMLTGMSTEERMKYLDVIGKGIAANGSPEQINAWGETVAYFDNNKQPVKVKDRLPINHYAEMANAANVSLNEEKYRGFLKRLEGVSSTQVDEVFDDVKGKDPLFYKSIADKRLSIKKNKEREEKKAREAEMATLKSQYYQNALNNTLDDRFACYLKGKEVDSFGMPSNSKELTYDGKKKTMTDSEIIQWGQGKLQNIFATVPAEEAGQQAMQLLTFPPMRCLVRSIKDNNAFTLTNLNVASLVHDEAGSLQLPDNLNKMLAMYRSDKEVFRYLFEGQGEQMAMLDELISTNGLEEGVSKYAAAKENMRNNEYRDEVNKLAKANITFDDSLEIPSLGGTGDTADISLFSNSSVQSMLSENFKANLYCGQTEEDALENAKQRVSKYFTSFKGCAIPKGFFYKIPSKNQEIAAVAFLDHIMQKGDGDRLLYMNGTLQIWKGNTATSMKWDDDDFAQAVADYMNDMPASKRVKLEEVYTQKENTPQYYEANPDAATIEKAANVLGISFDRPFD